MSISLQQAERSSGVGSHEEISNILPRGFSQIINMKTVQALSN